MLLDTKYVWKPPIFRSNAKAINDPTKGVYDSQSWHPKGKKAQLIFHSKIKHCKIFYHEYKRANRTERQYYVWNTKTKQIDFKLIGVNIKRHKNGTISMIPHISGRKGSELKAHELYRHLIKNFNHIFYTKNHHSIGGKKVWQKLSKFKDVSIIGICQNQFLNVNLFEDEEDVWTEDERDRLIITTNLVATYNPIP